MKSPRRLVVDIGLQRVRLLYSYAVEAVRKGDYNHARYLISVALSILRRLRLRKPLLIRRGICKNCLIPLVPGLTSTVRIRRNRVIVTCRLCGYIRRYPLTSTR